MISKFYGPPGTGKTYRMLQLFEHELKTVPPERIAFFTFTRAARFEALSRASLTEAELPFVKTLHATTYKLLNVRQNQLVQPKDLRRFGKSIGVQLSGYMQDLFALDAITEGASNGQPSPTKADRLLQINHLGRHRGLQLRDTLKDMPLELDFAYAKWFTLNYRKWKDTEHLLDFTDLLTEYVKRGPELDVDVVFVDEAQDLSWLQWQVFHKLAKNAKRAYLCGDDDQAIFIWAGASAELFNTEPADHVEVLPQSYRIPRCVHALSQQVISRIKVRQQKEFRYRDAEGIYRPVGHLGQELLDDTSTLVLFRNHHRGMELGRKLEELGVPFVGSHAPLSQEFVKEALEGWYAGHMGLPIPIAQARAIVEFASPAYLQPGARSRALSKSATSIPVTGFFNTAAFKANWWQVMPRLPRIGYLQRVIERYGLPKTLKPTTTLLSIHQSKGREANTVVLDLELARRTYEGYQQNPDDEARVYYVGITRARERLFTLMPGDPMHFVL